MPGLVDIREARFDDFLQVAELDRRAWKQNRNSQFIPDGEHVWRLWCEHALTIVAAVDGSIAGVILAFPCRNGSYCVHKVFVDEAWRGKGIGSKLFERCLEELDRLQVDSFLTVDPANERALKLYEKWGYAERTFVPGYYRKNEDRYVLTRRKAGL